MPLNDGEVVALEWTFTRRGFGMHGDQEPDSSQGGIQIRRLDEQELRSGLAARTSERSVSSSTGSR